jgi:hypothetical protein
MGSRWLSTTKVAGRKFRELAVFKVCLNIRLHDPSRSAYTKYMELFFSEFFYKINFEAMLDFWLVSRHLNGGR